MGMACESHVCILGFRAGEEEEMGYTERAAHGGVVFEFVGASFLPCQYIHMDLYEYNVPLIAQLYRAP